MIGQPDTDQRVALARSLAPARLRPYRSVFGGDTQSGLSLYLFEMQLVAAMQQVVAVVEVLMREQMHRSLSSVYGAEWYAGRRCLLDDRTRNQVRKAQQFLGRRPSPGKVVAEMDFGTWTYLLETGGYVDEGTPRARRVDYDADLWLPALVRAFPHAGAATRADIGLLARRARWARNRMAHRESILFGFPHPGQTDPSGRRIRQARAVSSKTFEPLPVTSTPTSDSGSEDARLRMPCLPPPRRPPRSPLPRTTPVQSGRGSDALSRLRPGWWRLGG